MSNLGGIVGLLSWILWMFILVLLFFILICCLMVCFSVFWFLIRLSMWVGWIVKLVGLIIVLLVFWFCIWMEVLVILCMIDWMVGVRIWFLIF